MEAKINYRNIIKQTKGLSKILDTSAVYWKEAADDLGKTFCQCGNRENIEIVETEFKLNKDKPDDEEPNLKKNKKPKIIHNLVNVNTSENQSLIELMTTKKENKQKQKENENSYTNKNQSTNINETENFNSSNTNGENTEIKINTNKIINNNLNNIKNPYNHINNSSDNINDNNNNKNNELDDKKLWTAVEDELLVNFIKTNPGRNWKKISNILKNKTPQQCAYRYTKLYKENNFKKWNRSEDINLIELHEKFENDWENIAKLIPGRTAMEVEERYSTKLDPNLKRCKFEPEEDEMIMQLYGKYGNKWNEIAKHFNDRNASMIKNRYYSHIKKKIKINKNSLNKKSDDSETITEISSYSSISPRENFKNKNEKINDHYIFNNSQGSNSNNSNNINNSVNIFKQNQMINFNSNFDFDYNINNQNNSKQNGSNANSINYNNQILPNEIEINKNILDSLKFDSYNSNSNNSISNNSNNESINNNLLKNNNKNNTVISNNSNNINNLSNISINNSNNSGKSQNNINNVNNISINSNLSNIYGDFNNNLENKNSSPCNDVNMFFNNEIDKNHNINNFDFNYFNLETDFDFEKFLQEFEKNEKISNDSFSISNDIYMESELNFDINTYENNLFSDGKNQYIKKDSDFLIEDLKNLRNNNNLNKNLNLKSNNSYVDVNMDKLSTNNSQDEILNNSDKISYFNFKKNNTIKNDMQINDDINNKIRFDSGKLSKNIKENRDDFIIHLDFPDLGDSQFELIKKKLFYVSKKKNSEENKEYNNIIINKYNENSCYINNKLNIPHDDLEMNSIPEEINKFRIESKSNIDKINYNKTEKVENDNFQYYYEKYFENNNKSTYDKLDFQEENHSEIYLKNNFDKKNYNLNEMNLQKNSSLTKNSNFENSNNPLFSKYQILEKKLINYIDYNSKQIKLNDLQHTQDNFKQFENFFLTNKKIDKKRDILIEKLSEVRNNYMKELNGKNLDNINKQLIMKQLIFQMNILVELINTTKFKISLSNKLENLVLKKNKI